MTINRRAILGSCALLAANPARALARQRLAEPFTIRQDRWRRIKALSSAAPPAVDICPPPPSPIEGIKGTYFYSNQNHSIVDSELHSKWQQQREPLLSFIVGVENEVEKWLVSGGTDRRAAACAASWLGAWADANALLGFFNGQGMNGLRWCTVGLANAYLNIRLTKEIGGERRIRIDRWFGKLALRCRASAPAEHNNHYFWAAAATASAGVAFNDFKGFDWAMQCGRVGAHEISDGGTLPLELARGRRALGYHCFALSALLILAEYGKANGIDLYDENGQAIARLVDFILRNMDDPAEITRITDKKQVWGGPSDGSMAWAEIWQARFPDERLLPVLKKLRPLRMAYMGGNQTLMFGRRAI